MSNVVLSTDGEYEVATLKAGITVTFNADGGTIGIKAFYHANSHTNLEKDNITNLFLINYN